MKKIYNKIVGWNKTIIGKWETAMVKQMNLPTQNTISVLMGVLMFGGMIGIGIGITAMTKITVLPLGLLITGVAGALIIIGCASYIFYDQVYKPMKAYEDKHGSCGLGDTWLEKRHNKKNKQKPILQSKARTVTKKI